MVGHFLNEGLKHIKLNSRHSDSILYLHTDIDTCMHICILTADYTVKSVKSRHSKRRQNIA